jgi:hypothetical protein
MDIWVRTMSSEYRRDSDVPRLRDESAGDAERGGPPNIVSLDLEVVSDARRRCRRDGLVGSSDKSARRITDNELKALSDHFTREDGRLELPMQDLMWFALHSTRRVSEICRLEWQDNEPNNQSGLVRDGSRRIATSRAQRATQAVQNDPRGVGHRQSAASPRPIHLPL